MTLVKHPARVRLEAAQAVKAAKAYRCFGKLSRSRRGFPDAAENTSQGSVHCCAKPQLTNEEAWLSDDCQPYALVLAAAERHT